MLTVAPSSESHTSEVARMVPSAASAFATTKAPLVCRGITVSYPIFLALEVKVMLSRVLPSIY